MAQLESFGDTKARLSFKPTMLSPPSASIIIPACNRVRDIDDLLASLFFEMSDHYLFEVIVVDYGSTDGTIDEVRKWQLGHPVVLLRDVSTGLRTSIAAAAQVARYPNLIVVSCEAHFSPVYVQSLIEMIDADHFAIIGGSCILEGNAGPWAIALRRDALLSNTI